MALTINEKLILADGANQNRIAQFVKQIMLSYALKILKEEIDPIPGEQDQILAFRICQSPDQYVQLATPLIIARAEHIWSDAENHETVLVGLTNGEAIPNLQTTFEENWGLFATLMVPAA